MAEFIQSLNVSASGTPLTLTTTRIEVGEVGNTEIPRDTVLTLSGPVPDGADSLSLTWPAAYGALVLRQQGVDEPYTGYLEGGQSTGDIHIGGGDEAGGWMTFATYIPVGFDHILPKGLDHILFVLGLFFLSTRLTPLLWQVTAFTLAHTITLAMAVLGLVSVPASIVEPLIAASIVYVAVENILSDRLSRWRPVIIFGFGLLHGLGFASVLGEFGLPDGKVIPALGIYGTLAVVFFGVGFAMKKPGFQNVMGAAAMVFFWPLAALSVLCAVSATRVDQLDAYRRHVAIPASAAIAAVGAYWFVERVFL
jgi:hydrogenase/urease accessory protein HupE